MAKPRASAKQKTKQGKVAQRPAAKPVKKPAVAKKAAPAAKTPAKQPAAKKPAKQPAVKKQPAKPAAKKPAAKSLAKQPAAKAKQPAAKAKQPAAKAKQPAAKRAAKTPAAPRRRATNQLSLPGFKPAAASDDSADDEPGSARADQIASVAAARAAAAPPVDPSAPVRLGTIMVPSGTLAIFDVALVGYLPREALDPMLVCAEVPGDRALAVIGTRVGKGRFADCWDHVAIELAAGRDVARTRKLGEAAVDFARLICMDRAAIAHWQHDDSLDGLADVVAWGRDETAMARALNARKLSEGVNHHGHGWVDLPVAEAEAKADRIAELKAEHGWQLASEVRRHSHHFAALAAARVSPTGAGSIELAGARVVLFFTSWGDGVYPVYLDVDADGQPVRIRIQLAPADLSAIPATGKLATR